MQAAILKALGAGVLALLILLAAGYAAFLQAGVQGAGIVGVLGTFVGVLVGIFVIKPMLFGPAASPFKAKGQVLAGAVTRVHSIRYTPPLPDADPDEGEREWYIIEVSVEPGQVNGPFQHWTPGEFQLVDPASDPAKPNEEHTWGRVVRVRVWGEHGWEDDEGLSYNGEQRVRLLVAVRPGAPDLHFRYYMETFGKIDLTRADRALENAIG